MFFDEIEKEYKLVAPDVDELLRYFDRRRLNPVKSTPALLAAASSIFEILAPLKGNEEVKTIYYLWG